jgi:predicted ATPase
MIGVNGTGKSTPVEAIVVATGFARWSCDAFVVVMQR